MGANSARIHHVGFAVASIKETGPQFAESIGVRWHGEIIHDPLQQARVSFLSSGAAPAPALELIEPADSASPLHNFLAGGGGLHHVCYEVDSLEEELKRSRSAGGLVVKEPLPAVAFGGRLIAWVYSRERLLLEYLERSSLAVQP